LLHFAFRMESDGRYPGDATRNSASSARRLGLVVEARLR
jgi:hypothetical protein